MTRLLQVAKYGWIHAGQTGSARVPAFIDILIAYKRYGMWSNQYMQEKMYALGSAEKRAVGEKYAVANRVRDDWQRDFRENKKFLHKYMNTKYEFAHLRAKRNDAYRSRYNMGRDCLVEHSVEISRQHYLPGTIEIGDRVLLAKNCFLDYSGHLKIGNDVQITDGVHIITHDHKHHRAAGTACDYENNDIQTELVVGDGAVIGTKAVVLSSCHSIGRFARIGAGAVVTKDIPDFAVAVGVPARVVKINEPLNQSDVK